jgi:hypothetical protein
MKSALNQFRGIIHIHTTYSYDGSLSLSDVIDRAKKRRYDFVMLTEHAEDFDAKKMQMLVDECTKSTNENFLVIPGLEFNMNNEIHILGAGITTFIHERDPEIIIRKVHENGGIAILAHTADYRKEIPYAQLKDTDLIEIWNPRYGERLSPSMKSLRILCEFRRRKRTCCASGGLDLHTLHDLVPLYQIVLAERLSQHDILDSLKQGKYSTTNGYIELPALQDPTPFVTILIYICAFLQFIPRIIMKTVARIYKFAKQCLSSR